MILVAIEDKFSMDMGCFLEHWFRKLLLGQLNKRLKGSLFLNKISLYNSILVYCRELAPGTVSLTGDWAQGDDR